MSFCSIDRPNVMLTTLKKPEDGSGLIIRLIETQGIKTVALVTLPHITVAKAALTNLVEQDEGQAVFTKHEVQVKLEAFGISTIRIEAD